MAENDWIIGLIAGLDENKSREKLNKDIETIQSKLNNVKVGAELDVKVKDSLLKQLNNLKIALLDVTISENAINKMVARVNNALSKINISEFKVDAGKTLQQANQVGQQIDKVISDSAQKAISNVSSNSIGKYFKIDSSTSNQFKNEMGKLVEEWTNAKGKLTDVNIQTRTSYDEKEARNIERLHQATVTYKNELDEVIKKTIAWRQIGTTTNAKGEEEILRGFVEVAGQYSKSLDTVNAKTDSFVEKQQKAVASAQSTLSTIESKLNDPNISKSLSGTDFNANGLNTQLERVKSAISVLGSASKDTFTQAQIDVNKEITSLNNLISTLKNAEYAATSLRTKDINTVKIDEGNNLNAFVQKMEQSGHYTDELKQKVENLRTQLNGVFDANTLTSYLNGLSNLQSEFKSVDATAKTLEKSTKLQTNIEAEKKILQVYTNELKTAGVLTDDVKEKIQNMFHSLSKVDSQNGLTTWRAELKGVKAETDAVLKSVTQLSQKKVNEIQLSLDTGETESKVEALIAKTQQWTDTQGNARISTTNLSTALNELTTASETYVNNPTETTQKRLIESSEKLDLEYKKITNSVKSMNAEMAKDSAISSLHNKVDDFMSKNGKAVKYSGEFKRIFNETAQGAQLTRQEVTKLNQEFSNAVISARNAGRLGKTFFQTIREGMSSFSYWTSSTFLVMKAIQSVKGGLSSVRELDTALVDLKKTTSMTNKELEAFYYASNDVAKQMGVTTKEILEQAAAWSRLGFSSAESATKMAQYSSKFASISPGMGVDEAQEGLVSIIKAWDIDVDQVEREVLDNINTLGNRFAESNADLVQGMKRSAAALAATGTTYQDAFALFTGAQEVVQNAEVTGRALRSISMRIHGYSEDSEDGLEVLDEELKNITGDLIDLTKTAEHSQGVSIFKEGSTTEFKSLVEYFGEINDIWSEMSQVQQNDFLDKAFGKNQAQAGAAIIQNYKAIAEAIEAMEDAGGSAEREMSIIMDSIDYKLNTTAETATGIAQNLFKKEDMKAVIDVVNSFLGLLDKVTDKLGLFGTIGLGAGLFAGFKNVGSPKMFGLKIVLNIPTVC